MAYKLYRNTLILTTHALPSTYIKQLKQLAINTLIIGIIPELKLHLKSLF